MASYSDRQQQISLYLLGQLTEEEREDFEREFFAEDERAAEVLAAEETLMEEYASGAMDPARRRQFERLYLGHPAQREELRLHESLRSLSTEHEPASFPAVRKWAVAACLAFLAIGLVFLFRENRQLQQDIRSMQALQQQHTAPAIRKPEPARPVTPVESPKVAGPVPAILLVPGMREAGARIPVLQVPSTAIAFVLEAEVSSHAAPSYQASIESIEGAVLFETGPLKAVSGANGRTRLALAVTTSQLKPGDYILVLRSNKQKVGEYYFRLQK